ncbi:MAG: hypothetical protein ABIA04_13370, partial [Pseudomonadota bacterium]
EILNDDIKKHYEAQLDYISDLLSHENPSILFNKDNIEDTYLKTNSFQEGNNQFKKQIRNQIN